jgi:hypothetical protein
MMVGRLRSSPQVRGYSGNNVTASVVLGEGVRRRRTDWPEIAEEYGIVE